MIGGGGGVFDVRLDGALVELPGRDGCGTPEPEVVVEALREALG